MSAPHRYGFTLLELLIVIGIMGLLGTVSVGGFRGIKKGMEERAALQVVDEFVRSAYRRAVIDRVPTAVYFWNETVSDESVGKKLVVVGRAVAVRRAGRITRIDSDRFLIDEFGDLAYETYRDEEGVEDSSDTSYMKDPGRYLYRVGDTSFARSIVSSSTVRKDFPEYLVSSPSRTDRKIRAYAYYLRDEGSRSINWEVGDPYGFEFAELTLPKNYIFGSSYSTDVKSPEKSLSTVLVFTGNGTIKGGNVTVSGLQLDKSGNVAFKSIGQSADPKQDRK